MVRHSSQSSPHPHRHSLLTSVIVSPRARRPARIALPRRTPGRPAACGFWGFDVFRGNGASVGRRLHRFAARVVQQLDVSQPPEQVQRNVDPGFRSGALQGAATPSRTGNTWSTGSRRSEPGQAQVSGLSWLMPRVCLIKVKIVSPVNFDSLPHSYHQRSTHRWVSSWPHPRLR